MAHRIARMLIGCGVGLLLVVPACRDHVTLPRTLPPIEVHFSPKGGCTEAVVKEIGCRQERHPGPSVQLQRSANP